MVSDRHRAQTEERVNVTDEGGSTDCSSSNGHMEAALSAKTPQSSFHCVLPIACLKLTSKDVSGHIMGRRGKPSGCALIMQNNTHSDITILAAP